MLPLEKDPLQDDQRRETSGGQIAFQSPLNWI
jgi:hypothetical protein